MDMKYKIEIFSEWHCGSGLSAGADTDVLAIKDVDGMPYIPGKTMKGLFREAVEDLMDLRAESEGTEEVFHRAFGYFNDKGDVEKGCVFFSNAELPEKHRRRIKEDHVQRFLYRRIASTAIGQNGVALANSLRSMETVVPCTLEGVIKDLPDEMEGLIRDAARFIKRLGRNRNRGLGRCDISIIEPKEKEEQA